MAYDLFVDALRKQPEDNVDIIMDSLLPSGRRQTVWGLKVETKHERKLFRGEKTYNIYAQIESLFDADGFHLITKAGDEIIIGDTLETLSKIAKMIDGVIRQGNAPVAFPTYTKEVF